MKTYNLEEKIKQLLVEDHNKVKPYGKLSNYFSNMLNSLSKEKIVTLDFFGNMIEYVHE